MKLDNLVETNFGNKDEKNVILPTPVIEENSLGIGIGYNVDDSVSPNYTDRGGKIPACAYPCCCGAGSSEEIEIEEITL